MSEWKPDMPKAFDEIGKTYDDWIALNEKLKPYHINIFYLPQKGWRAYGIRSGKEAGTAQEVIQWMGNEAALEWFDNTLKMVDRFFNKRSIGRED